MLDAMDEEQQAGDATGAVPLGVLRGSRRLLLPLPLLVLLGVLLMAAAAVFAAAAAAALAVPPRWLRGWWQGPSHGQGGQSPLGATAAQGPDAGPLLGSYWRVGVESVGSRGSATASLPAPMHPGVGAGLGQGALLSALSRGSAPPRVSRLGQVLGSGMGLMARPSSLTSIDVQD